MVDRTYTVIESQAVTLSNMSPEKRDRKYRYLADFFKSLNFIIIITCVKFPAFPYNPPAQVLGNLIKSAVMLRHMLFHEAAMG
jgi:hypothetical protein